MGERIWFATVIPARLRVDVDDDEQFAQMARHSLEGRGFHLTDEEPHMDWTTITEETIWAFTSEGVNPAEVGDFFLRAVFEEAT